MTHSPAFWIAFIIAVYMIFDAARTLRMMRNSPEWDRSWIAKLMGVTLATSLGLLTLVAWMEYIK